jgi:lipoprotein-anchoring transpeptidase ErfK/SrfK
MRVALRNTANGRAVRVLHLVGTLGAAVALVGCGSSPQTSEPSQTGYRAAPLALPRQLRTPSHPHPLCSGSTAFAPSDTRSYAVAVRTTAVARSKPAGGGAVLARYSRIDLNGYPTVFGVVGARTGARCAIAWYRVQLNLTPNGRTGWVAARSVRPYSVRSRIVVDLSARRLVAYLAGKMVVRTQVAVGDRRTPTPTGRYFVNERFRLDDPDGPFGVAALGISAHSNVLRNWIQGGPIALHGTNQPGTIGEAASHGCIRLANTAMWRLFSLTPAGTPVDIRA